MLNMEHERSLDQIAVGRYVVATHTSLAAPGARNPANTMIVPQVQRNTLLLCALCAIRFAVARTLVDHFSDLREVLLPLDASSHNA